MFAQLKNLSLDRLDVEEAVALYSFGSIMQSTYTMFGVPSPDWLDANMTALGKEIRSRHRDMLEARLKSAMARRDALKTAEEKRAAADSEIEALQKALAG